MKTFRLKTMKILLIQKQRMADHLRTSPDQTVWCINWIAYHRNPTSDRSFKTAFFRIFWYFNSERIFLSWNPILCACHLCGKSRLWNTRINCCEPYKWPYSFLYFFFDIFESLNFWTLGISVISDSIIIITIACRARPSDVKSQHGRAYPTTQSRHQYTSTESNRNLITSLMSVQRDPVTWNRVPQILLYRLSDPSPVKICLVVRVESLQSRRTVTQEIPREKVDREFSQTFFIFFLIFN